jgi:hypothetical protein
MVILNIRLCITIDISGQSIEVDLSCEALERVEEIDSLYSGASQRQNDISP